MPRALINGVSLYYETLGAGDVNVVLTPGGRLPLEFIRPTAERLAESATVLLYDNRNRGASGVSFEGDTDEWHQAAEDLHALIRHLDLGPAFVGGTSGGAVVSLLLAAAHPEDVRGLLLWSVGAQSWGVSDDARRQLYTDFIDRARVGGMAAVLETEHFEQCVAAYPPNRELLLKTNVDAFVRWMRFGEHLFEVENHDNPIPFVSVAEIGKIRAPALVIPGNDPVHTPEAGKILADLMSDATLLPPLLTDEEAARFGQMPDEERRRLRLVRPVARMQEFISAQM